MSYTIIRDCQIGDLLVKASCLSQPSSEFSLGEQFEYPFYFGLNVDTWLRFHLELPFTEDDLISALQACNSRY